MRVPISYLRFSSYRKSSETQIKAFKKARKSQTFHSLILCVFGDRKAFAPHIFFFVVSFPFISNITISISTFLKLFCTMNNGHPRTVPPLTHTRILETFVKILKRSVRTECKTWVRAYICSLFLFTILPVKSGFNGFIGFCTFSFAPSPQKIQIKRKSVACSFFFRKDIIIVLVYYHNPASADHCFR